jgi:hypothetical protein
MIKMRLVSIVLPIIAAVAMLLAACNAQTTLEAPQVIEPAEALTAAEDTVTSSPVPLPSSTATIAYTPTATLLPPPPQPAR